jgi:hypothetical protein
MATVYHAHDPRFRRDVAIKVLPREFLHDPAFRARFEREAQTIAALEHPAIVPVYDFGEADGQPYLVMRYMPGGSLLARLAGHTLTPLELAPTFTRIAAALDEAHSRGVIHRDIKPGNILFDAKGEAYLSDFGIAKLAEATASLTGSSIIGTPEYMSPEQARGEAQLDGRSDIYSLGVVMFQALTGRLPFEADTPIGLALRHISDPVPPIRHVRPDLPSAWDDVTNRVMAKKAAERYPTAAQLAQAVNQLAAMPAPGPAGGGSSAPTVYEPPPTAAPPIDQGATVFEPVATALPSPHAQPQAMPFPAQPQPAAPMPAMRAAVSQPLGCGLGLAWAFSVTLGGALTFGLALIVLRLPRMGNAIGYNLAWAFGGCGGGVLIGLAQFALLRRRMPNALAWSLALFAAWFLTFALRAIIETVTLGF